VVALVLSAVALVLAVLAIVVALCVAALTDDGSGWAGETGSYPPRNGTAALPELEPYPAERLEDEVTRVLTNDEEVVETLVCDITPRVREGARTECEGVVDGLETQVVVTFEDDEGHFTFTEDWQW
jgi:hypothetical protein